MDTAGAGSLHHSAALRRRQRQSRGQIGPAALHAILHHSAGNLNPQLVKYVDE